VCLPETFTTVSLPAQVASEAVETVPGPTTDAVAKRARQHQCYVICPIQTLRDGHSWNSAVVIDRSGGILASMTRSIRLLPPTTTPSLRMDCNRPVGCPPLTWTLAGSAFRSALTSASLRCGSSWPGQGARIVFWPSAYNGGFPLQAYAYMHHYYVVSSVRSDRSKIIDPCGVVLAETDQLSNVIYRDINLDYLVCHYDFNEGIPDRILAAYPGRVEIRSHRDDAHFLIEPTDSALTIAELQRELGFEPTFQYHARHREAYARILEGKSPLPQQAAHGDRGEWSK